MPPPSCLVPRDSPWAQLPCALVVEVERHLRLAVLREALEAAPHDQPRPWKPLPPRLDDDTLHDLPDLPPPTREFKYVAAQLGMEYIDHVSDRVQTKCDVIDVLADWQKDAGAFQSRPRYLINALALESACFTSLLDEPFPLGACWQFWFQLWKARDVSEAQGDKIRGLLRRLKGWSGSLKK